MKPSIAIRRLLGIVGVGVVLYTLTMLAGCEKRDGADSHSHDPTGKPAAKPDEHAGHDHGSAEEGHVDEVTLSGDAIERYRVKVDSAQLWVLKPTIVTPARVAFNAEAMAHVGSPLRGRAVEVKVRLGDAVKVGQELVIVESMELGEAQADYLQKQSAVQTGAPTVDLAKVAWERARNLQEQSQGISLTEVQRREAEYKAAVAGVKAAEAAAKASENRLHLLGMKQHEVVSLASTGEIVPRYAIKAAIDGIVVEREVTLGELVSPDREALMILADTNELWVLADVPEAKLSGIVAASESGGGAKAWVTFGSMLGEGTGSGEPRRFDGTVAYIAPMVDPTTRTAQVRIALHTGERSLRPGMFAEAEIVLAAPGGQDPAPVVAVPDEAIQSVEGGPAVFVPVPNEPNTFAKRAVTVGKAVGGLVPIYAGLVEGESFITSGTFILKAELGKAGAAHEH